jgi:hypothetical protein
LPDGESEIFLQTGLDRKSPAPLICPSGNLADLSTTCETGFCNAEGDGALPRAVPFEEIFIRMAFSAGPLDQTHASASRRS